MGKTLILENDNYIFKNKVYSENQINILRSKMGKNVRIYILRENILVRKFSLEHNKLDKFINNTIGKEAEIDSNLLLHYQYNTEKKILYVYSIRKGNEIKKISEKLNKLSVIPIQFFIHNQVRKKGPLYENSLIMADIKDIVYIVAREEGAVAQSSFVDIDNFNYYDEIKKFKNCENIIVDNKLNEYIPKEAFLEFKIIFKKIGECLNVR